MLYFWGTFLIFKVWKRRKHFNLQAIQNFLFYFFDSENFIHIKLNPCSTKIHFLRFRPFLKIKSSGKRTISFFPFSMFWKLLLYLSTKHLWHKVEIELLSILRVIVRLMILNLLDNNNHFKRSLNLWCCTLYIHY